MPGKSSRFFGDVALIMVNEFRVAIKKCRSIFILRHINHNGRCLVVVLKNFRNVLVRRTWHSIWKSCANDDDRQSGEMSSHINFQQVTLFEAAEKYLLRPQQSIIGLKAGGRASVFAILSTGGSAEGAGDYLLQSDLSGLDFGAQRWRNGWSMRAAIGEA
jgi:hypothetical protein